MKALIIDVHTQKHYYSFINIGLAAVTFLWDTHNSVVMVSGDMVLTQNGGHVCK